MSVRPHAAGLYPTLDSDWRAKSRHAGWLVYCPLVGWPMVLGYRKALTEHFFQPLPAAMPEWTGRHREHLWNGIRAIGVIQGYLSPLWVTLAVLLVARGFTPGPVTYAVLAACALAPIFTNILLPCLLLLFSAPIGPWIGTAPLLTPVEAATLSVLFHLQIFLVPAGFLRVSATGRFLSAFNLRRTMPFILRRRRDYLRAWWFALWMNGPILPLVPFFPWLLSWAYVASLAIFNQLLLDEPAPRPPELPRARGWLAEAERLEPARPVRRWRMKSLEGPSGGPASDGVQPIQVLESPFFTLPRAHRA